MSQERHVLATKPDLKDASASDNSTMTFPAIRGMQAGKAYYVVQMTYSALLKLFKCNEEDVLPADLQARRALVQVIGDHIAENPYDYVLPAITASISAAVSFEAVEVSGATVQVGLLHIPLDAIFISNDSLYHRLGIEHALQRSPFLRDETIAVTIFYDLQRLKFSR